MENTGKNIELIDKFILNQRRSRMWTIISVCLFLLMAALVLMFSKRLAETKGKLTISEDSLHMVNARLIFLNDSIQKAKDSVDQVNIGLELNMDKNAYQIDSLGDINDTLTVLLNTTQKKFIQDNSSEAATRKINDLFEEAFPGPAGNPSDKIRESIIKTKIIREETEPLSISILYMNKYSDLSNKINKLLESKKLNVERMEPVSGTTFNPTVKYFRKEDEKIADRIADIMNESYASELKQPFAPQLINLKSPPHHVEIWIGHYEKKDMNQLILDAEKFKRAM